MLVHVINQARRDWTRATLKSLIELLKVSELHTSQIPVCIFLRGATAGCANGAAGGRENSRQLRCADGPQCRKHFVMIWPRHMGEVLVMTARFNQAGVPISRVGCPLNWCQARRFREGTELVQSLPANVWLLRGLLPAKLDGGGHALSVGAQ